MEAFEKLEHEWATWNGLDPKGMVCCASGTAALHLALESLELPAQSEIVTSDFNMIAVPRAIAMAGHVPVFVDCDERLLMDSDLWKTTIDGKHEASLIVHIYGRRWEFPKEWDRYAKTMWVIEDLAEAHGVRPHPQTDAACWSFYVNKIVAGQEGGAVWFRDPEHAKLARSLRSLGFTDAHDFWHRPRGWNHRMSNLHAELILGSLANVHQALEDRRELEALMDARCPKEWRMPPRDVVWVYDLRLPWGDHLDQAVSACRVAGIEARHSFKPMHKQEEFRKCQFVHRWRADGLGGKSPDVSLAWTRVMYLPVIPGVTDEVAVNKAFDVIEWAIR